MNPSLKYFFFFFFGGGGGGGVNRQTDRPEPICPFNFFEIGGITMNKCSMKLGHNNE